MTINVSLPGMASFSPASPDSSRVTTLWLASGKKSLPRQPDTAQASSNPASRVPKMVSYPLQRDRFLRAFVDAQATTRATGSFDGSRSINRDCPHRADRCASTATRAPCGIYCGNQGAGTAAAHLHLRDLLVSGFQLLLGRPSLGLETLEFLVVAAWGWWRRRCRWRRHLFLVNLGWWRRP